MSLNPSLTPSFTQYLALTPIPTLSLSLSIFLPLFLSLFLSLSLPLLQREMKVHKALRDTSMQHNSSARTKTRRRKGKPASSRGNPIHCLHSLTIKAPHHP